MAATMRKFLVPAIFLYTANFVLLISGQIVKDLTDEIGPWKQKDQAWLVMFHAPWCGHCRSLSPIYHRVGQDLHHTDIRVGKLDCTVYGHIAGVYDVRGFPTVKYIRGESNFTHRGERSKEDLIEFTKKAHGPAVREIPNYAKFMDVKSAHADSAFFMYVGETGPNQALLQRWSRR